MPPVSAAVPLIVTGLPTGTVEPVAGDVIVDAGAVESLDAIAVVKPACKVLGCTPMSARG